MEKFEGTIAIVTGASGGIGLGIAKKLIQFSRLEVIGFSRREIKLPEPNFRNHVTWVRYTVYDILENKYKISNFIQSWIKCDVGNAEDVENAFSEISLKFPDKRISILINNAANAKLLPLLDHEKIVTKSCVQPESLGEAADIYRGMMDTNILGPTLVTRAAMKYFDHTKVFLNI